MKIALLCGGPSVERGISLNSARSVLDHLERDGIEIIPIYFDHERNAYYISKAQLYSNTPSDFDFKLKRSAIALTESALLSILKKADLVFPIMHGVFGEDGQIQEFLEKYNLSFIGSSSVVSRLIFDKYTANEYLKSKGFYTLPSVVLEVGSSNHKKIVKLFFQKNKIKRAIVKPAVGGSSIGVFSVSTSDEALEKARLIFIKGLDKRVVIEPFASGKEFTVIVLENRFGKPVAILPTEIETDYQKHQIFDYRKKYLPTRQVVYHCPPRFSDQAIKIIQTQAEKIFAVTGMKDFGRFDGWLFPDGKIWFADLNPISGMEQNSFLFQQSSRIGFSHRDILRYIVRNACRRYGIPFPDQPKVSLVKRKPVNVLFGGQTSERQVSLMGGTNVWLKLKRSKKYEPTPFLFDLHGNVWELPYALTLNHTVEEIKDNCIKAPKDQKRLNKLEQVVRKRLQLTKADTSEIFYLPKRLTLRQLAQSSKFIFLDLHGGIGEDGTVQKLLKEHKVKFNGSDEQASALCVDKWKTEQFIKNLNIEGIKAPVSKLIQLTKLNTKAKVLRTWEDLCREFKADNLLIKPSSDGCSTGIVRLYSASEFNKYLVLLKIKAACIPKNTFKNQTSIVEMPLQPLKELLFEKFIETDEIKVQGRNLLHKRKTGWVEITIGLLEENRKLKAFNPSITVSEGEVLTVEEKFQGGTGINLTPPPASIVSSRATKKTQQLVKQLAEAIGIRGYARVDAFMNIKTGHLIVLEVNTLPALTPSTVLFHQALAEPNPMYPREFLERLISNKDY